MSSCVAKGEEIWQESSQSIAMLDELKNSDNLVQVRVPAPIIF